MDRGPWYERWLARRREASRTARDGLTCAHCGCTFTGHRRTMLYCSVACRKAAHWRRHHPIRPRARVPREPTPPPVATYDAHPLVTEALALLRPHERHELGGDMDSTALDLIGTYCVAAVAGEDAAGALRAERSRQQRDRRWLVHGPALVTGLER